MAKKRGAPAKPPDKAKAEVLQIRLSGAEKRAFARAAEIDGKKVSEWIRDRLRAIPREELQAVGDQFPFLSNSASSAG